MNSTGLAYLIRHGFGSVSDSFPTLAAQIGNATIKDVNNIASRVQKRVYTTNTKCAETGRANIKSVSDLTEASGGARSWEIQ